MLKPDFFFESVCDITPEFLAENQIRALILDIDNTIAVPDKRDIPQNIQQWLAKMKDYGIKLVILSNNTPKRVSEFAKGIDVPYVGEALKPKKDGYIRAAKLVGEDISKCGCVGDQIFTDILGGNRVNAKTVLTKPFAKDQTAFIYIKRIFEKPFLAAYKGKGRLQ